MDKFFDIVESVCISIILVTTVILFIGRVIVVDGESMADTLHSGEKVIISNFLADYEKNDIVVTDGSVHNGRPIIKRIVATEGDTINIDYSTGDVYLNGNILEENYIKEKINADDRKENIRLTIPQGYLFLMGDNRNYSLDSRSDEIGLVSENDILGKTIIRISPLSQFGKVN